MCRRCGEPDKRPPAKGRRALRQRWLDEHQRDHGGDGTTVPCTWGYPQVCKAPDGLTFVTITMDRLDRGSTYNYANCVPACQPCNYYRYLQEPSHVIPEGCQFGPVTDDALEATG